MVSLFKYTRMARPVFGPCPSTWSKDFRVSCGKTERTPSLDDRLMECVDRRSSSFDDVGDVRDEVIKLLRNVLSCEPIARLDLRQNMKRYACYLQLN